MKNKFILFSLAAFLMFFSDRLFAQSTTAAGYSFYAKTTPSSAFTYLSGGTELTDLYDDDAMEEVTLGFTFKYCGTDYTKVYASTNGYICFDGFTSGYVWPPQEPYLGGLKKAIMPLWEDLGGTTGIATYKTTGSSPNRVFTIEYKDWGWDYGASDPVISFQVLLYETTNIIQFIYKSEDADPSWDGSDPGAYIGICASSTDYISLNNSSTTPTASSTTFTDNIVDKPATGQIYEFSPLPQCSGTPTTAKPEGPATKVCSGVNFTLTENATETLGKTYQWQSRAAGTGTFIDITGATKRTLTTSVTANTDFQLIATCTYSAKTSTSLTRTVEVLTKPSIATAGATNFCSNQLLRLSSASDATYKYEWIEATGGAVAGATTNQFDPKNSGRYTLKVSTSSCVAGAVSADTVDVTVKPAPTAAISPAPSVTICDGEITTLKGSGKGDYQWINTTTIIAGATDTIYKTSAANNYRLVITNPANSCKDTSDVTQVISTPPPTVSISPTVKVRVCTGLSTILSSATSGSGLSYQWMNSGDTLKGENGPTITTSKAGIYTLIVKAGSCNAESNKTEVALIPLPDNEIKSSGTTKAICPMGNDFMMQAPIVSGYSYQWSFEGTPISGAISSSYAANAAGNYEVKVTDIDGCISYSDVFKAENTSAAFPEVSPSDISFCDGNSVRLFSSYDKYYVSYQWYSAGAPLAGETTKSYTTTTSGTFAVEVTDSFNCKTMSSAVLSTVNALPEVPVITFVGKRLSTKPYATYQWYRNGKALTLATKRTLDISFDGIYTVRVSNEIGCFATSEEYIIKNLSIGDPAKTNRTVYLYPNPSSGIVHIEYAQPVTVIVKDMQGRQIAKHLDTNEVEMSSWADGIYFFSILDKENNLIQNEKVVKRSN